jgi:diguanylate cyclase (GGDEF)-like protein
MAAFNGRTVAPVWLIGGGLVWAFVSFAPVIDWNIGARATVFLTISAGYLLGAAYELWQTREERLPARWPLVALLLSDFAGLAFSAVQVAPLTEFGFGNSRDIFWPVYIGAMIFTVGSTALVIALVSERTTAKHRHAAETDGLTGLANRGALIAGGETRLVHARAERRDFALILFDLDRFKSVNDTYGHQAGDAVLRRFAEALSAGVRPNDLVGRIGGEEFVAIVPGAGAEAAIAIADRVRRNFATGGEWFDGKPVRATASAGIAVLRPTDQDSSLDDLLGHADQALYAAKTRGRNCVSLHEGDDTDPDADGVVRIA